MKLFLGEYNHALDERGRVTLPKKIRSELEGNTVIVSRGWDNCIFGYDRTEWEKEAAIQVAQPVTDRQARSVRRYMFAGAEKVEIDKLGRMVVPAHLKEYAGLSGELTVVGAGDHFEVWEKTRWQEYMKKVEQS